MKIARGLALAAVAVVLAQTPGAAVIEVLSEPDIAHALNIAGGSEAARSLFHTAYIIAVDDPVVEHLEAITEFRRFVMSAEEQSKAGNWMMARGGYDAKGRTLKDLLRPVSGRLSIRARLRFHPQNNYVTLPAFDILVGDPTLLAIDAVRTPHITPATGEPGTRDVITGATVEVFYNAPTISDRVLPIRLLLDGSEVARVRVDFARLE